jgi:hypothetical protein
MTSKKKLLIIGTSHTAGYYHDDDRNEKFLNRDGVWSCELEREYDVDIYAWPGVTSDYQLHILKTLKWVYPERRYDACIIEGRLPINMAMPVPMTDYSIEHLSDSELIKWVEKHNVKNQSEGEYFEKAQYEPFSVWQKGQHDQFERWRDYYYDDTVLHVTQGMSSVAAVCTAAETMADRVAFICITGLKNVDYSERWHFLLDKWFVPGWHGGYQYTLKKQGHDLPTHICHHLTASSNKIVAKHLTPDLKEKLEI